MCKQKRGNFVNFEGHHHSVPPRKSSRCPSKWATKWQDTDFSPWPKELVVFKWTNYGTAYIWAHVRLVFGQYHLQGNNYGSNFGLTSCVALEHVKAMFEWLVCWLSWGSTVREMTLLIWYILYFLLISWPYEKGLGSLIDLHIKGDLIKQSMTSGIERNCVFFHEVEANCRFNQDRHSRKGHCCYLWGWISQRWDFVEQVAL